MAAAAQRSFTVCRLATPVSRQSGMKRLTFVQSLLLTLLASTPLPLEAQRARWEYLGEANIDGGSDHDRIRVGESKGQFRRIRFLVERSAVHFDRILVHYGNGTSYPAAVQAEIPAGGRTREIDLPGDRRWIESVEVWYRRGNWVNDRKPKIRLMGIRW
jgi:hypothetical protein